jgi:hypothetical protein
LTQTKKIRINADILETLRQFVLEKYGKLHGFLLLEANQALRDYLHAERPKAQQQQKDRADSARSDVREKLQMLKRRLTNDFAIGSIFRGYELGGRIQDELKLRDKRTVRKYAMRLLDANVIRLRSGRVLKLGNEEYELV